MGEATTMTAIDRAKKMLADADHDPGGCPLGCEECGVMLEACGTICSKAHATLAVTITLAEYAQGNGCEFRVACRDAGLKVDNYCDRCKALAEWEKLLPEEEA